MFIHHYITFSMCQHTLVSTAALLSTCISMCSVSTTKLVLITTQSVNSQFSLQESSTKQKNNRLNQTMRKSTQLAKNVICCTMSSLKAPTCMLQHCTVLFRRMWSIIDWCMSWKLENFISCLCNDVESHCYRISPNSVLLYAFISGPHDSGHLLRKHIAETLK
jgi:hypothetical protein